MVKEGIRSQKRKKRYILEHLQQQQRNPIYNHVLYTTYITNEWTTTQPELTRILSIINWKRRKRSRLSVVYHIRTHFTIHHHLNRYRSSYDLISATNYKWKKEWLNNWTFTATASSTTATTMYMTPPPSPSQPCSETPPPTLPRPRQPRPRERHHYHHHSGVHNHGLMILLLPPPPSIMTQPLYVLYI